MNGSDEEKVLEFNLHIGKKKPDTVHRKEPYCPFCDVENLKGILTVNFPFMLPLMRNGSFVSPLTNGIK